MAYRNARNDGVGGHLPMPDEGTIQQQKYYEETASEYRRMHVNADDEHYHALAYIARLAPEWGISSFLDVGSGTGRAVEFLNDKGFQVKGVEPVPALLQEALRVRPDLCALMQCGRGESLPFSDGSFDAVCEFGVLHHVRHPDAVIKEMLRVARKAVFLSDANRFGQGRMSVKIAKLLLFKAGLWPIVNLVKTGGRGFSYSEGDGVFYSYSVYDSLPIFAAWAQDLYLVPTLPKSSSSWYQPLLTSQTVLLCAFKQVPDLS
jgi:SAM-dependent methyltransferase